MFSYCGNCEKYNKEIFDLRKRLDDLQGLAKRIIQTDLLIQKYSEKESEFSTLKQSFENQKKELETVNNQLKTLQRDNNVLKSEKKTFKKQVEDLNANLKTIQESLAQSNENAKNKTDQYEQLKKNFETLNIENDRLKTEIEDLRSQLQNSKSNENESPNVMPFSDYDSQSNQNKGKKVLFYLNERDDESFKKPSKSNTTLNLSDDDIDKSSTKAMARNSTAHSETFVFDVTDLSRSQPELFDGLESTNANDAIKSASEDSKTGDGSPTPVPETDSMKFIFGEESISDSSEDEDDGSSSSTSESSSSSSGDSESEEEEDKKEKDKKETTEIMPSDSFILSDNEIDEEELSSKRIKLDDSTKVVKETKPIRVFDEEMLDSLCEELIDEFINSFYNQNLNELIADILPTFVFDEFYDGLLDVLAREFIELRENVIDNIGDNELNVCMMEELKEISKECIAENEEKNKVIREIVLEIFDELFPSEIQNFLENQRQFSAIVDEYSEDFVDSGVKEIISELVENYIKFSESCSNEIIDEVLKPGLTEIAVEELEENKAKNEIISCVVDEIVEEKVNELVLKESEKQKEEYVNQQSIDIMDIDLTFIPDLDMFEEEEKKTPERNLDEILTEMKSILKPLIEPIPEPPKITRQPVAKTAAKTTPPKPNTPTAPRTLKDQIALLNSFKKSEPVSSKSSTAARTPAVDLQALIRDKKRELNQNLAEKFKGNQEVLQQIQQSVVTRTETQIPVQEENRELTPLKRKRSVEPKKTTTTTIEQPKIVNSPPKKQTIRQKEAEKEPEKHEEGVESLTEAQIEDQSKFIKNAISVYFRKFNIKVGFTFEELDNCINRFLFPQKQINCELVSLILVKHFLNNHLIPITEEIHFITRQQFTNTNFLQIKLTNEEEKYVYLVNKLSESERFKNLFSDFVSKLKAVLLTNVFNEFYNLRIVRLITFMCKSKKQIGVLRAVIYDIMFTKARNFYILIVLIGRIWPESLELKKSGDDYEVNPVLITVVYLCKNQIILDETNKKLNWNYLLQAMEKLCSWKIYIGSSSELFSYLQKHLLQLEDVFVNNEEEFKLSSEAFDFLLAFKLICAHEGWKWTSSVFLAQFVKSILAQWTEQRQKDSSGDDTEMISDDIAAFYLFLQGNIVAHFCPSEEKSQAIESIKNFLLFIKNENSSLFSFLVESAVVEALLLMVPFDPTMCFSQIQIWLRKNEKRIAVSLRDHVKLVYKMYKTRLPNYIVIPGCS